MTIDKQQLRELASKATPGPWLHHEEHGFPFVLGPDDELLGGPVTVVDGSENLSSEDSAYIAAASPSTVLALLDEIAEVLAERDAMQSMLTQATRERDEARRNYQFMVDRAADEKLDGYRELGERAAKAENERDAVIARAETILGDRDLGIRRIAELTARAEKAERERDELRKEHA